MENILPKNIPDNSVLMVIDMQNDFCESGSLPVPGANKLFVPINKLIDHFSVTKNLPILYSQDWHPFDTTHFLHFPIHCVADTPGANIHKGIQVPPLGEVYLVRKGMENDDPGYSAIAGKTFDPLVHNWPDMTIPTDKALDFLAGDNIYLCGVATEYCVKATVLDALKAGFHVNVITDAIAAVNDVEGEHALNEMEKAGATLWQYGEKFHNAFYSPF